MMCPFPVEGFWCTCGGGAGISEFFIAFSFHVSFRGCNCKHLQTN